MRTLFRNLKRKIKYFCSLNQQKRVLPNFLKQATGKKVLLISHQLTTTGSPLMLYYLAKELVQEGFSPMVLAYRGGSLAESFKKIGVPVLCGEIYNDNRNALISVASNFDKIVANSIVCYPVVETFKDAIWWIHEGQNVEIGFISEYPRLEPVLRYAENVFVVSDYAKKVIDKYSSNTKVVMLGVDDYYKEQNTPKSDEKVKFALVGDVCDCKAQDVLVDAILKLDTKYLEQCEFHFYCEKKGRRYRKIAKDTKHLCNVFFDGLISNQEVKWSRFSELDVFVIPSRDESCSLVALEACMLKKPIIVSENVGAKYMVKHGENGYIVPTADSEKLKEAIEAMIINKNELGKMGEISRQMYQQHASFENHIQELQQIIDLCRN